MNRLLSCLCLFLLPWVVSAATVDLGPRGVFSVNVPKGWTLSSQKMEDTGFTVTLSSPEAENSKCMFNITFVPNPQPVAKEKIDEEVLTVCDQFVEASVEKKKVLRPFNLTSGVYGSYCVFTDASLVGKPAKHDDFKVIGMGIIHFSDEVMAAVFVGGGNDDRDPSFTALLSAVSSATVSPR